MSTPIIQRPGTPKKNKRLLVHSNKSSFGWAIGISVAVPSAEFKLETLGAFCIRILGFMITKSGIFISKLSWRLGRRFWGRLRRLTALRFILILTLASPGLNADESDFVRVDSPEAVISGSDRLDITLGSTLYTVESPTIEDRTAFISLPEPEKESFSRNRKVFLSALAKSLNTVKYGFAVGALVSRSKDSRTLRERAEKIVGAILNRVDKSLWTQAPLFARSNEFGIVIAGGLEFIAGKRERGWGGIVDFGLTIGYNRDERALTLQIIRDVEHYQKSALPVVFLTGALTKAGFYVANQKGHELQNEGISFYPPMAPAFSSITPNNFMTGFSSGLTWPPSPVGDMLTYTDKLDQTVILRLSISPLLKGFVRVTSGIQSAGKLNFVMEPVKKALKNLFGRLKFNKTCERNLE